MLVLSGSKGQRIIVHNDTGVILTIEIVQTSSNKMVLGFEASKDIKIDREKIYKKKQEGAT